MASDPSLIEISGEDDSLLLQQIPTDGATAAAASARNLFSCSPLQIHGSRPRLPPAESVNKENVNLNKYEMVKLSLEPQQMKRKKKGGGYNLRKSLAWDRAFFTEEGILDPAELSMISGNIGSSAGEKLPMICEEGGESLSEFSNSQSDSGDLLALKEKPSTNEGRTKHSSSPHQRNALTRRDRPLVSSTKRKVLLNNDVNGNKSKRSGGSQSTMASKEAKVSKKPATKPDSTLRTPTARTALQVGQPKHGQLARSGASDKNNAGPKVSSSNKTHSRPSTLAGPCSKPPTAKYIAPQAKRNLGKSTSRPTPLTRRNDSLEEIEGQKNPPARDNGAGSIKIEAAYPVNALLKGGSTQHVQLKAAKPTGLRTPSPSLGFFRQQPKASTKGLLNSYTQPSYDPQSAIGSSKSHTALNPLSKLKPPHVHEKAQKMTIDDTKLNIGLSTEVSAKSLSQEHQKQNADPEPQAQSNMKVKMQHEILDNHQKIHGFLKDGSEGLHRHMELQKIEIKPLVDDGNVPVDDDTPFLHTGPCGKEEESNFEKNDMIGSQCVEGLSKVLAGDATVFSHSPCADSSACRIQSSFGLPDHQLPCAEGVSESSEKVKVVESHIYDNSQTSVTNLESQARFMGVGLSEEFQKNCEENVESSNDQNDNANEEQGSFVLPLKLAEQVDSGFHRLHDSSTESSIEDLENLVFYGSLTASHGGTSLAGDHAAEEDSCKKKGANENDELLVGAEHTMSINEQPEVHAVEQVAHEKEGAIENDDLLLTELCSSGGEHQDNALMIKYSPLICQHACGVQLNSSTVLCPVLPSENVHQSVEAKRVEVLYAEENQSAQQESAPIVENSAFFSDQQSTDNVYLPGQVDGFNLGSSLIVNRDQKLLAATDVTSASFVGLGNDPCSGIKEEDRYVSIPLVSAVQDGDDDTLMEMECDDEEENQILLSVKNASVSLMTGRPLPDTLTGIELSSREVDTSSHEDSRSGSFGQHQKLKDCNLPDVSVHVEDPSWQDDVDQTNEEFHSFDNAMKNSSTVVGQQQLLDGNSSIDCSLKMKGLAGDDNLSFSNQNAQSGYQPELHNPCFILEPDSQAHQVLSSNIEISTVDNCLKEPKRCFVSSGSLYEDDVPRSECLKADVCSQVEPVQKDNFGNVGISSEDANVEGVLSVSVEKHQSNIYNASLEDDGAVDVNRDEFSIAERVDVMVSSWQSSEEVGLDVKNDRAELPVKKQCIEASQLKSSILPEKADSSIPTESFTCDVQRQHQLGSTLNSSKDTTTSVQGEICKKDGKQESAIVKPPPDAAPFSEEWLAAFEAAGEEILTMKHGAVQHSPPDKTLPEPSPWSPVKRKNNQAIGPFDCTKFSNICNSIPESSSE
ncbi:hypothetical protein ACJRO7_011817 [Eucalyptus globulus]|uniref:Uncharacterized protein n=1 Tax=Eucalyptus globulus TaxID=34317 RepID=A0ABD3LGM5_EUCGL